MNQNLTFGANAFFDGGRVLKNYHTTVPAFLSNSTLTDFCPDQLKINNPEKFHLAVGGGLRFILNKNFIIAVDYGRALNKQDNGKMTNFYVKMGWDSSHISTLLLRYQAKT